MTQPLDGPRLAPASGGPARSLVVFLHGYGADGNDLIDIGRAWAPEMPDTAFASPNAPHPCGMAPVGREWFPLTLRDPSEYRRGAVSAAPHLDGFLDAELARLGLTDADLVLVGFSQGTMMALHTAPRRPAACAGIVGYSGLLPGPETLTAEAKVKPPVLLVHGDADQVVPPAMMPIAGEALREAGFTVSTHASRGLGHGIGPDGLRLGLDFAKERLAKAT
ncbi:MAG: dienelactone hydrolase family protein [Pseudomonadota bacterium]